MPGQNRTLSGERGADRGYSLVQPSPSGAFSSAPRRFRDLGLVVCPGARGTRLPCWPRRVSAGTLPCTRIAGRQAGHTGPEWPAPAVARLSAAPRIGRCCTRAHTALPRAARCSSQPGRYPKTRVDGHGLVAGAPPAWGVVFALHSSPPSESAWVSGSMFQRLQRAGSGWNRTRRRRASVSEPVCSSSVISQQSLRIL